MKIGVIGGGLMGLAVAYRLSKSDAEVKVFEREGQPGGLTTYHDYGKFYWDRFYHVILPTDTHLIGLINELGLGDKLHWERTMTGYFVQNKYYSISSTKEFLLFPPLGIWSKLMLALTIILGSRIKNWRKLEKISVENWLVKVGGRNTFEKFWRPLLLAKLGESYHKVSAVFIWSYIKRLFQARDSSAKNEHMGYVSGGYKTLFNRLEQLLAAENASIHLNTSITSIKSGSSGGISLEYGNTVEHFDKVIFTGPVNILERVAANDLIGITNNNQIEYLGVICLVLVTNAPLTLYYVLNIAEKNVPFTGVIGMSTLVDREQTAGQHLTYFPKYLVQNDPLWDKTESELKEIFLEGVRYLYPDFNEEIIVSAHINKAFKVQPLQVINYSQIVPKIETKHPDFYVLNTSQFVHDTLNNNSVVQQVNKFVENFGDAFKLSNSARTKSHV